MTLSFIGRALIGALKIGAILAVFATVVLTLASFYTATVDDLQISFTDAARIVALVFSFITFAVFALTVGAELIAGGKKRN